MLDQPTYGMRKKSFLISTSLQTAVVAVLFTALSNPTVQEKVKQATILVMPADLLPMPASKPKVSGGGGGGGGDRSPLPASKGQLPKAALRQFVPPSVVTHQAALTMEPSIVAPPEVPLPAVNFSNYGDPLGKIGPPSNGTGSGGGIGSGSGGGVGSGTGAGVGPGQGGGIGGGVFIAGKGGVTNPIPIYRPDPLYADEARKAHLQGTVVVEIVVDEKGKPTNLRVLQSLGLGLDEQAIQTVSQWRFKPGMRNGKPVPVMATVSVGFHLL